MRPAWAVAVAAASLAADRSGKDNAVASRTIPARARRPLPGHAAGRGDATRSEEHTSELQSLMRISYAVFCLHKKKKNLTTHNIQHHQSNKPYESTRPTQTHNR